jgi:hypothetical protein
MANIPFSDFGGSGIKQIIRGTITITSPSSGSASQAVTIASVNTAKSMISILTSFGYSSASANNQAPTIRVDITSATQVTAYVDGLTGPSNPNITVGFQVVEYY